MIESNESVALIISNMKIYEMQSYELIDRRFKCNAHCWNHNWKRESRWKRKERKKKKSNCAGNHSNAIDRYQQDLPNKCHYLFVWLWIQLENPFSPTGYSIGRFGCANKLWNEQTKISQTDAVCARQLNYCEKYRFGLVKQLVDDHSRITLVQSIRLCE